MLRSEIKYYADESMFHGFIPHVMGTRLDILMIHSNLPLLNMLWAHITDELERLDKMLNRFDATSEVSKLNSHTQQDSVSVSAELEDILRSCQYYYEKTLHLFDITLNDFSQIQIHGNHHISFSNFSVTLDFGGFAKGYALKKIQEILLRGNIENAFVDFGNSSIMGIGHHPYGDCWKVSLQNPYTQQTLDEFCLTDNTLSTSGNTEQYTGHIINPLTGIYNEQKSYEYLIRQSAGCRNTQYSLDDCRRPTTGTDQRELQTYKRNYIYSIKYEKQNRKRSRFESQTIHQKSGIYRRRNCTAGKHALAVFLHTRKA